MSKNIEFPIINTSFIPDALEFETLKEVQNFMNELTAIQSKITVNRVMTHKEKQYLREEYQTLLEDKHPLLENDLIKALSELAAAKKKAKEAEELLKANTTEARALAKDVKLGLKPIDLDSRNTYQIPFEGKYYYYTFVNDEKSLLLCKIEDIPEDELEDLYVNMNANKEFFESNFGED